MKRALMFLLLASTSLLLAQEKEADREKRFREETAKGLDTTKATEWQLSSVSGINLTQVSFKDWAQGGANSLAYGLWGSLSAVDRGVATRWSNNVKLTFGQARVGDQDLRKTDDEIYLESLLIYLLGTSINPYGAFTLRTQFAPGYAYFDTAPRQQISAFFDPAYLTQSVGLAYSPVAHLTVRVGAALREVVTSAFPQYADDPETPEIEKTRVDGGLESVVDFQWTFAENMLWSSRLELFAPFKSLDRVVARNDNTVAMKVNQYVTVNFNVQLINDVDVTARTQVKEALAVGFSYTLL
jgi:hypothetical protein